MNASSSWGNMHATTIIAVRKNGRVVSVPAENLFIRTFAFLLRKF